jgi:hypothetical protein
VAAVLSIHKLALLVRVVKVLQAAMAVLQAEILVVAVVALRKWGVQMDLATVEMEPQAAFQGLQLYTQEEVEEVMTLGQELVALVVVAMERHPLFLQQRVQLTLVAEVAEAHLKAPQ